MTAEDDYCEKNDSYSVMNTLVDIDCSAQYEPYHISRKRGKVREMEYKRKVDKKLIPTCNIMGVNIAAINMEWLIDYLEKNISEIKGDYICVSNVHTTVTSFEDADYCAIQNGGLMAIPDGGPLSTVGQKRGHKNMERTTGPSLMGEIFEISAKKGYRHYFYGSKESLVLGCPCISSDRCGASTLIQNNFNGLVVNIAEEYNNHFEKVIEFIRKLDKEKREIIEQKAKDYKEIFSWKNIAKKYAELE